MAAVSKTAEQRCLEGSTPSPSAEKSPPILARLVKTPRHMLGLIRQTPGLPPHNPAGYDLPLGRAVHEHFRSGDHLRVRRTSRLSIRAAASGCVESSRRLAASRLPGRVAAGAAPGIISGPDERRKLAGAGRTRKFDHRATRTARLTYLPAEPVRLL